MKIHIVQKGDTLWDIAQKYGVDFEELKDINSQLSSPDMVMPGMKIKVPSSTKAVKKEKVQKETKVNEGESGLNYPKKPTPSIQEDEKEKKINMKPEMPMPQMPQPPHVPEYPMMQMPNFENEINNYTMINTPQTQNNKQEMKEHPMLKPKEKEVKQPKETKMQENHQMHHQHMMDQNMNMTFEPMPYPTEYYTHMQPVCCHMIHPCCAPMPMMMPPMHGGMMPEQHPMQPPMEMPMNHPGNNYGDCGCNQEYYGYNNNGHQQPYHMGNESMQYDQPMGRYPSMPQQTNFNPMPPNFNKNDDK